MRQLTARLLDLPSVGDLLCVPLRPGRHEPRIIRRRMKEHDLLTEPPAVQKQRETQGRDA